MFYINFMICNNRLLILYQNNYYYLFKFDDGKFTFAPNGYFSGDESIIFQRFINYNFSYDLTDDHIRSYGYFEFENNLLDSYKIKNIIHFLLDKSKIKYLMQSGTKYECDIDLKNFINNEQLLRESKLNKILN